MSSFKGWQNVNLKIWHFLRLRQVASHVIVETQFSISTCITTDHQWISTKSAKGATNKAPILRGIVDLKTKLHTWKFLHFSLYLWLEKKTPSYKFCCFPDHCVRKKMFQRIKQSTMGNQKSLREWSSLCHLSTLMAGQESYQPNDSVHQKMVPSYVL